MSRTGPDPGREGRPPWGELRERLVREGFRPSRRLGQNFLLDENLVRAIVRDAPFEGGELVLEVGAGLGFLTWHLLDAGARVVAVEVDPRLAERAREWVGDRAGLRWIEGDVLQSKHRLSDAVLAALPAEERWHLVSNLPYAVASPVLANLAELPNPPASMTVLVQKEVAERLAARPGTPAWGPLSVRLQLDYEPRELRRVAPALFWPRPEVESAVVALLRRPAAGREAVARSALMELASRLFQRRRQSLGRVLGDVLGDRGAAAALLAGLGFDGSRRAETLEIPELERLSDAVRAYRPGTG